MPRLQKIADRLKSKGLTVITINTSDTPAEIKAFLLEKHISMPVAIASNKPGKSIDDIYGVQAYPTDYLLDSTGKVIWTCVGYDEDGLLKHLGKMGVK